MNRKPTLDECYLVTLPFITSCAIRLYVVDAGGLVINKEAR
jgi:hypothetical protein